MQYSFGSGYLFGQRTDVPNATPVAFGTLQDVQVEFAGKNEELYGQGQVAAAIGRGQLKITGKAKLGAISGLLYNNLYFGAPISTGQTMMSLSEAMVVPAATPYTATVSNAATFVQDGGVVYAATGLPLTLVSGAPTAAGQYSVSNGVYTFFSADASAAVLSSYAYAIAATGQSIAFNNPTQGIQPVFQVRLVTGWNNPAQGVRRSMLTLYACVGEKASLPTKMAGWAVPEFDFTAFQNAAGQVFNWSFPEIS